MTSFLDKSGLTYYESKVKAKLNNKVDKVSGKGLSTNDYTTTEKNKLAGIASGAEVNVQSDWNTKDTSSDSYIKNKPTIPEVHNGQLIIQVNGEEISSFYANQSANALADIIVPEEVVIGDTEPTDEDTKLWIDTSEGNEDSIVVAGDTLPIGTIIPYFDSVAPTGWLMCDGKKYSKFDYPELYEIISHTLEVTGTEFVVPDLRGRVLAGMNSTDSDFANVGKTGGEKTHTLSVGEMPNHNHSVYCRTSSTTQVGIWGASSVTNLTDNTIGTNSAGGNQPHNNLQPYTTVNYIIKAGQNAGLVGTVGNTYSNSETDTYSCHYVNNAVNGYVLFNGTDNGTSVITLNDDCANYNRIDVIIYNSGIESWTTHTFYEPNGKQNSVCDFQTTAGASRIYQRRLDFNGNRITTGYHRYTMLGSQTPADCTNLIVKKVIGYK